MLDTYDGGWTVYADVKAPGLKPQFMPVGVILVWVRGWVIQVGAMIWFPWASPRNIIEGAVVFLDTARRDVDVVTRRRQVVLIPTERKHKAFFDRLKDRGLVRAIGTIHEVVDGGIVFLYQTKRVE